MVNESGGHQALVVFGFKRQSGRCVRCDTRFLTTAGVMNTDYRLKGSYDNEAIATCLAAHPTDPP